MKKSMKLALITVLAVLGFAAANAQTTNISLQVNVTLTGFSQGEESSAVPVRLASKNILTGLGGATTARLVALSPGGEEGGPPTFAIRERQGTAFVDTPISSDQLSVSTSDEVVGRNGTTYTILTLHYDNGAGTDFTVDGFATLRRGNVAGRGVGLLHNQTVSVTATVAGTGHVDGAFAIFKGNVSAAGARAELTD